MLKIIYKILFICLVFSITDSLFISVVIAVVMFCNDANPIETTPATPPPTPTSPTVEVEFDRVKYVGEGKDRQFVR